MERRDNRLDLLHVLVVMALHVAAMGGGCLGAALVHRWQTRSIYVSIIDVCNTLPPS